MNAQERKGERVLRRLFARAILFFTQEILLCHNSARQDDCLPSCIAADRHTWDT